MLSPVARSRRLVVRCVALVVGLAAGAAVPSWVAADELADKGRELVAKHAPAVVWVTANIKQDMAAMGVQFGGMPGQAGERRTTAIGTVVDPSGIVVVATNRLKPPLGMVSMMIVDGQAKPIETKTELSKPVIQLADGTEVPARIALEDPDTGLTYLAPDKPLKEPLASMPPERAAELRQLDQVFQISREGKKLGTVPNVSIGRISAVLTKPRRGYVPGGALRFGPYFDESGRFVGVASIQTPKDIQVGFTDGEIITLIIPAADLAEAVAQVRDQAANPAP